jgi:hypothetical protein
LATKRLAYAARSAMQSFEQIEHEKGTAGGIPFARKYVSLPKKPLKLTTL